MIITNCPRCGSMNITTAGVCANCGWSQFAQVTTVSTKITGEIEIMLSGKVLLDDYKRLLLENRNLKECVAELEAENVELKERVAMLDVNAVYKSLGEMGYIEQTNRLHTRIAELEAVIDQLIEAGEKMFTAVIAAAVPYDEGMREWDKIVNDWKEG